MTTERLTAADGPQGDDWATETQAKVNTTLERPEVREAVQAIASDLLAHGMLMIADGMDELDRALPRAMERLTDDLDYGPLAETVAWLQAMKARLGVAEAFVARELGRMDGVPEVIELPDGRTAQVNKGKDRKEWRHDDWKRDVREAVLEQVTAAWSEAPEILTEDGEVATLPLGQIVTTAMANVQAVHGSAAPKVTALKPLGLAADDYCTSSPGPYSVRISTPTDTTTEG